MYMGIVQAVRPIIAVIPRPGHTRFDIDFSSELLADLKVGASVSIEGTCMTVTKVVGPCVTFEAIGATLETTNLHRFECGDYVNIERSAKMNDEVGGHRMAGHVATTAEVTEISKRDQGAIIQFRIPPRWSKYAFPRGFLGVNGCSLTVAAVEDDTITINLIPETLRRTTFARYQQGDLLNIEVDHQTMVLVDVVERVLTAAYSRKSSATAE